MAITRSKLGFFEATKGAATGLIGAGTYCISDTMMGWFRPAVMGGSHYPLFQAAGAIALGRFIYGFLAADRYGNDRVQEFASRSLGLSISTQLANDFGSIMQNAMSTPSEDSIKQLDQFLQHGGQSYRDQIFTATALFSLAKNVASGVIGFGVLSCLLDSGTLTCSLSHVLVDVAYGVATCTLGSLVLDDVSRSYRM
jgi:hypothetical protein